MRRFSRELLFCLLFTFAPIFLAAQDITDFSYNLINDRIEISYSLSGNINSRYNINLYASLDGFTIPLVLVTGEIGKGIIPGKNKKVVWQAKKELGEFKGGLSLKLRAREIPFLNFHIEKGARFKRDKKQRLSWDKNGEEENIKLELYQNNAKIGDLGTVSSGNNFEWSIPKDLKSGKNYRIRGSGSQRYAESEIFSIKRRVPLLIWLAPAVVIGGVVTVLVSSSDDNGNDTIPDPVGPN
jgi:hypothetical protein